MLKGVTSLEIDSGKVMEKRHVEEMDLSTLDKFKVKISHNVRTKPIYDTSSLHYIVTHDMSSSYYLVALTHHTFLYIGFYNMPLKTTNY